MTGIAERIGIDPDCRWKLGAALLAGGLLAEIAVSLLVGDIPRGDPMVLQRPFSRVGGGANSYLARVHVPLARVDHLPADTGATMQLYENGARIGPAHSPIPEIGAEGKGRYLFSFDGMSQFVAFSSSDNSDPNTNGRTYRIFDPAVSDPYRSGAEAAGEAKK